MIKGRVHDVNRWGNWKLITKYTIEYIDNKHDWDLLCSDKHPAPWELYGNIVTYDLQDAIEAFLVRYVDEKIFDVRMWEDIMVDDELVRQTFMDEIEHIDYLREQNTRKIKKKNFELVNENEMLKTENELFREYIDQFKGAMDSFRKFCDLKKGEDEDDE